MSDSHDELAKIRRIARQNGRVQTLLTGVGIIVTVAIALSDRTLTPFVTCSLAFAAHLAWDLLTLTRRRDLSHLTGMRPATIVSAKGTKVVVDDGRGTRLLCPLLRTRDSSWKARPGKRARVSEPFVQGQNVVVIFEGPDELDGMLGLPAGPARPVF